MNHPYRRVYAITMVIVVIAYAAAAGIVAAQEAQGVVSGDTPTEEREAAESTRERRGGGPHMLHPTQLAKVWPEVEEFFMKHAPARHAAVASMLEGSNRVPLLREAITRRYLDMKRLEKNDPALYEIRLRQLRHEDTIYALVTREQPGEQRSQKQLDVLREMVALNIAEREHRLKKVEQKLMREKNRLDQDRNNVQALVEERFAELQKDGVSAIARRGWWFDTNRSRAPQSGNNSAP